MNLGATSFRLGLHGMTNAAEANIVERDIALARATKGHVHVAHLSTREALQAVRAAKRARLRVTGEVTPHHFTLVDSERRRVQHQLQDESAAALGRRSRRP